MTAEERTDLKTTIERNVSSITEQPSVGQGTATTRVSVRPGTTTCDIEDGDFKLVADNGRDDGGGGLGRDPGVFVRGGLGACLAMGYAMWAARLDVPLDEVEVTVEADYDARGMFGIDKSVVPGWSAVRYTASVTSSAPADRVREVLETADRYSPTLDDLRRAGDVTGEHRITTT